MGRALPRLPRALLVSADGWRRALAWLTPALGAIAVHPHHSLVHESAVRRWHQIGLEVFVWTVNDTNEAQQLLDWGVDGLISDEPSAMRALTDKRRTDSARHRARPG
jgi:glycerophosphoryl diester phosphodiesterase